MFSCKAAFTMRFFSQHTHGDRPRHRTRFTRFRFFKRPPLVAPFRTDHTFAWACLLEAPEAHGVARAAQCVRLVEAPATGCSFFRPRNVFFQTARLVFLVLDPSKSFFRPPSFFQPRDEVEKKTKIFFSTSTLGFKPSFSQPLQKKTLWGLEKDQPACNTNNIEEKRMRKQPP